MYKIELLDFLKNSADIYHTKAHITIVRNNHMNEIEDDELLEQRHIEAVLCGFINDIATRNGIDYALYTKDLIDTRNTVKREE